MSTTVARRLRRDSGPRSATAPRRRIWLTAATSGLAVATLILGWRAVFPTPDAISPLAALVAAPQGSSNDAMQSHTAIHFCDLLLTDAQRTLAKIRSMQAQLHKRERIDGTLQELNVIDLKVRLEPHAVYMRWHQPDSGREAIWRQGHDDGVVLVHPGGWRKKLVPLVKVDPLGEQARQISRQPIHTAGLWTFQDHVADFVREQRARGADVTTTVRPGVTIGGRECYAFRFESLRPGGSVDFVHVLLFIDRERHLPIALEHYVSPPGDAAAEPILEESYVFHQVVLDPDLGDIDFDPANPSYEYSKR